MSTTVADSTTAKTPRKKAAAGARKARSTDGESVQIAPAPDADARSAPASSHPASPSDQTTMTSARSAASRLSMTVPEKWCV